MPKANRFFYYNVDSGIFFESEIQLRTQDNMMRVGKKEFEENKLKEENDKFNRMLKRRNKMKDITIQNKRGCVVLGVDHKAAREFLDGKKKVVWSEAANEFMNCEDELARMTEEEFATAIINHTDIVFSREHSSYLYN